MIINYTISIAQLDYGVSLGCKTHRIKTNYSGIETHFSPGIAVGGFVRTSFLRNMFSFEISANYAYLFQNKTYELKNEPTVLTRLYHKHINNIVFPSNYSDVYVPIILTFNSKYVRPFAGFEFYYKYTAQYEFENEHGIPETARTTMSGNAIYMGFDVKITRQIYIRANYSHGLTQDYKITVTDIEGNTMSSYIKNNYFEITGR